MIPAAGSGTRLGLGPKAFVNVAGRSLLSRSVAALAPYVDEVLVALPAGLALPVRAAERRPVAPGLERAAFRQGDAVHGQNRLSCSGGGA